MGQWPPPAHRKEEEGVTKIKVFGKTNYFDKTNKVLFGRVHRSRRSL